MGIPYDAQSSYLRGAAKAPSLIREAFHCTATNTWSERGLDVGQEGLLFDAGDLDCSDAEDVIHDIEKRIGRLLDEDYRVLSLGGDHAISFPVIRAYAARYDRLSILQFDAHPDLYDELDGNRYSHACPFARIMEAGLVQRLVQVGIRGLNGLQRQQAETYGVEVHEMKDWRGHIDLIFDSPLYISFDMDALDPAHAPGVSHFEPGGLSTREVLRIIQSLRAPSVAGADIVEYNPDRDPSGVTAAVAGKLLKEIASRMLG